MAIGRWLLALAAMLTGCDKNAPSSAVPLATQPHGMSEVSEVARDLPWNAISAFLKAESDTGALQFEDVAAGAGFQFVYQNGHSDQQLMVDATGSGCGWLDFDHDGWLDLIAIQGGHPSEADRSLEPADALFRNREGQFTEVGGVARLASTAYGQGVAVGDFDNDGFDDVFITNAGRNVLSRNLGDGTFEAVAEWGGESSMAWSVAAAWSDIDEDGDLDLYVGNYCDFNPLNPVICRNRDGVISQCQPGDVASVPDEFYINRGDGSFQSAAEELGIVSSANRALGVVIADFTGDSRPDIYVANDTTANFLWTRSAGESIFRDVAVVLGCATDINGVAQASMGVAVGDPDRNGCLDLYLTHFESEWNTFYLNRGDEGFADVTAAIGGVSPTLPWVGFGTVLEDFNHDGNDDIFVANGHIDDRGRSSVLRMPPQLFTFAAGRLREVSQQAGPYFSRLLVGRGCAQGDFDRDGDFDLAVIHQNEPAALLENGSSRGHWLRVSLTGSRANRRGIGARVTVTCNGVSAVQQMVGGSGYCSAREAVLDFGFGERAGPCQVDIVWPGGRSQRLAAIAQNQAVTILETAETAGR